MDVPPHPHTGLQTVSWLFSGEVEHRDSAGVHAMVRPGELNLMTAGAGICHSEVSTPNTAVLHGVQLWVALPDADRDTDRDFSHYAPQPHSAGGATVRVFLGELEGDRSPVHTFTPLLGAQVDLDPGTELTLDIDETFEHGVLLDRGEIEACGSLLAVADLAYQRPGHRRLHLTNRGDGPARAVLLGGAPFGEQLVMWWNFVGRSHDDIVGLPRAVAEPRRPVRHRRRIPRHCDTAARAAPAERHPAAPAQPRGVTGQNGGMTTDKTGAPIDVTAEADRFSISVDGQRAGFTKFIDHDGRRIFPHTEIDKEFGGRGLATILVREALDTTRSAGLRIVPVCPMVAGFVGKHPEYADVVDPVTTDVKRLLARG